MPRARARLLAQGGSSTPSSLCPRSGGEEPGLGLGWAWWRGSGGSPDGAAEEDGVLQDDGEARAQGVQRQFGDVDAIDDDAPCMQTVSQVGHQGAGRRWHWGQGLPATWVPTRMRGKVVMAGPPVMSDHTQD